MIGSAWLEVVDRVLRPARPYLERCLGARDAHLAARRERAGVQLRAMENCERRIDHARAEVFAADDGVVTRRMTELEREWRKLSTPDPDAGLMDLWAELVPPAWLDRKRFRDSEPEARLDALVALASDPEGVEAAERAVEALRLELASCGVSIGARVRWRPLAEDAECLAPLLESALEVARAACPSKIVARVTLRAETAGRELEQALLLRLPERPRLAADLAAAARVDFVRHAASLPQEQGPVAPIRALYRTGYALVAVDASSVTLAFPPV